MAGDVGSIGSVPRTTLDGFDRPAPHVLGIDAHGMEFGLLPGAGRTIARCSPVILVERLGVDAAALADALKSLGYAVYDVASNCLCVPAPYSGVLDVDGLPQV